MERLVAIYVLVVEYANAEPRQSALRDRSAFYVGQSSDPRARFYAHKSNCHNREMGQWIRFSDTYNGSRVRMKVLEWVPERGAALAEADWIHLFKSWGALLCNRATPMVPMRGRRERPVYR